MIVTEFDFNLRPPAALLNGCKGLLRAVIALALPDNFEQDDALRGFLLGSEGLPDAASAESAYVAERDRLRSSSVRRRIRNDPPDTLLTTSESLEVMLVSVNSEAREMLRSVRAVIVDEIHAFAGDDRGWHLLALLERIGRLAGRELQRIGLSAKVRGLTSAHLRGGDGRIALAGVEAGKRERQGGGVDLRQQ